MTTPTPPVRHPNSSRSPRALVVALLLASACATGAAAQATNPPPAPAPSRLIVEIYRVAPGQHLAFLQAIASYDEANRLAGLPPRQLYVHGEGADWDFMLIQPAETPADKRAALDAAWEKLGLPSGADFFLEFRHFIAEHTDTYVRGPTSAADYLATRKRP